MTGVQTCALPICNMRSDPKKRRVWDEAALAESQEDETARGSVLNELLSKMTEFGTHLENKAGTCQPGVYSKSCWLQLGASTAHLPPLLFPTTDEPPMVQALCHLSLGCFIPITILHLVLSMYTLHTQLVNTNCRVCLLQPLTQVDLDRPTHSHEHSHLSQSLVLALVLVMSSDAGVGGHIPPHDIETVGRQLSLFYLDYNIYFMFHRCSSWVFDSRWCCISGYAHLFSLELISN